MNRILIISADQPFREELRVALENAGYAVLLSHSLDESFVEVERHDPFLAIIDAEVVAGELLQLRKLLEWLNYRSRVVLLTTDQFPAPECECDYCLPKLVGKARLVCYIKELRRQQPSARALLKGLS